MGEQTIQDLLKATEKVFNNRETPEEREERIRWEERELAEKIRKEDREHRARENRKNQRELAQILFAVIKAGTELREPKDPQTGGKERPKRQALKTDQSTYCREQWKNTCPKRDLRGGTTQRERISPGTRVLYAGEDSD